MSNSDATSDHFVGLPKSLTNSSFLVLVHIQVLEGGEKHKCVQCMYPCVQQRAEGGVGGLLLLSTSFS